MLIVKYLMTTIASKERLNFVVLIVFIISAKLNFSKEKSRKTRYAVLMFGARGVNSF
jgi:hypothetical protein